MPCVGNWLRVTAGFLLAKAQVDLDLVFLSIFTDDVRLTHPTITSFYATDLAICGGLTDVSLCIANFCQGLRGAMLTEPCIFRLK
jgi:hypothetical protein